MIVGRVWYIMLKLCQNLSTRNRGILGHEHSVKTAVLVPLLHDGDDWFVLFEKRASTLRRQAGDICFPGGHVDETDPDEKYTALRETSEELGISLDEIEFIGSLDIFVASSKLLVFPYVGVILTGQLVPNPAEVEEIFKIELPALLAHQPQVYDIPLVPTPPPDFPFHLIQHGKNYSFRQETRRQWFFEIEGRVIWGLTARILAHFLDVVRQTYSNEG